MKTILKILAALVFLTLSIAGLFRAFPIEISSVAPYVTHVRDRVPLRPCAAEIGAADLVGYVKYCGDSIVLPDDLAGKRELFSVNANLMWVDVEHVVVRKRIFVSTHAGLLITAKTIEFEDEGAIHVSTPESVSNPEGYSLEKRRKREGRYVTQPMFPNITQPKSVVLIAESIVVPAGARLLLSESNESSNGSDFGLLFNEMTSKNGRPIDPSRLNVNFSRSNDSWRVDPDYLADLRTKSSSALSVGR